ncbi:Mov34/MPN/PAD-1 family protein [Liquorilactobacillus satsumensis]|uniref:Mov34/MPN/PAD-1 family protein n=1 Tax=Liquorilactobacillus TaxID=2767888 RepID=UPI0021C40F33|nr:Mov34/MPN/PAD-1 family protein [Liquorilactobacillus satsumensis]MCP9313967.1 Mov34/MPN/PAD-1 family protein [Liquorilactobacillus satsumensis]
MILYNKLKKYKLPNGKNLIVNVNVLNELFCFRQLKCLANESGGFLIGYEDLYSQSIIIEDITKPQINDLRSNTSFLIRDRNHFERINKAATNDSFFIGTWHTHPQEVVRPSGIDIIDWKKSLVEEIPGASYMIFIIVGRRNIKAWAGKKGQKIVGLREIRNSENTF